MSPQEEAGNSNEPRRGDAIDLHRKRPSPPDHPSKVIVHRSKKASTSQQNETIWVFLTNDVTANKYLVDLVV
jgi:hypothetical protein